MNILYSNWQAINHSGLSGVLDTYTPHGLLYGRIDVAFMPASSHLKTHERLHPF